MSWVLGASQELVRRWWELVPPPLILFDNSYIQPSAGCSQGDAIGYWSAAWTPAIQVTICSVGRTAPGADGTGWKAFSYSAQGRSLGWLSAAKEMPSKSASDLSLPPLSLASLTFSWQLTEDVGSFHWKSRDKQRSSICVFTPKTTAKVGQGKSPELYLSFPPEWQKPRNLPHARCRSVRSWKRNRGRIWTQRLQHGTCVSPGGVFDAMATTVPCFNSF